MIIDSNPSLQDAFREGLKKVGYRVLVLSDPKRAIDRCDTDERVADCVVFGCHSLGKTGLAAFNRFARTGPHEEHSGHLADCRETTSIGETKRD